MAQAVNVLQFSGHLHLRHRLVLSILSGKALKIDKIRSEDKNPGLRGARCGVASALSSTLTVGLQITKSASFDFWSELRMVLLSRYL